jgi:hypothetical protein
MRWSNVLRFALVSVNVPVNKVVVPVAFVAVFPLFVVLVSDVYPPHA